MSHRLMIQSISGAASRRDIFDSDADAYIAESEATEEEVLHQFAIGLKALFSWSNCAIYLTRAGLNASSTTVHKFGGASWAGDGTLNNAPTVTSDGAILGQAGAQYLNLGGFTAGALAGGVYAGTAHSIPETAITTPGPSNVRGLSIEDVGTSLGGFWAPYSSGDLYWDCLDSSSGRINGPAVSGGGPVTADVMHTWAGCNNSSAPVIRAWRDKYAMVPVQSDPVGPAVNLSGEFDRVQVGRTGTSMASHGMTLAVTWIINNNTVDATKHAAFYDLLRATVCPALSA